MSTKCDLVRDINGYSTNGLPFAANCFSAKLSSGAADTITVPSNFTNWLAVITPQQATNIWVTNNGTAAIPTGAFASTHSVAIPPDGLRVQVAAADVLSFITDTTTAQVSVSLYAID